MAEQELAAVRPQSVLFLRIGFYVFGALFFGLIPVMVLVPLGLPPGHPAFLVTWAVGAAVSLLLIHRMLGRLIETYHLTLTADRITLGQRSPTSIRIEDIVDTVPILSQHKPFQKATATVNSEQFTVVLLRMRDGSRLPLSGSRRVMGFENFLIKLFGLVGPTIRTQGELSPEDIAVMGARRANKLHRPGK